MVAECTTYADLIWASFYIYRPYGMFLYLIPCAIHYSVHLSFSVRSLLGRHIIKLPVLYTGKTCLYDPLALGLAHIGHQSSL